MEYAKRQGRIFIVIIFSNEGVLDAVTVCETLPCRHHSTEGEDVIIKQFCQINMTFDYSVETWRFGVNDLDEVGPRDISRVVAKKITQLLQSETRPIKTQPLSIASPNDQGNI